MGADSGNLSHCRIGSEVTDKRGEGARISRVVMRLIGDKRKNWSSLG